MHILYNTAFYKSLLLYADRRISMASIRPGDSCVRRSLTVNPTDEKSLSDWAELADMQ